jgi:hypothetical protein
VSKQGKGGKREASEDLLAKSTKKLKANHFGLHWLIRSWFAMAFRRRSLGLWAMASKSALRAGINMDDLFYGGAGSDNQGWQGVNFLPPLLLLPKETQQVTASRLRWSELPQSLLTLISGIGLSRVGGANVEAVPQTAGQNSNLEPEDLTHLGHRWITVREINCGISRYFVSPSFERDLATWSDIDKTFKENKMEAHAIFTAPIPGFKAKFIEAFGKQITAHKTPNLPLVLSTYSSAVKLLDTASPKLQSRVMVEESGGEPISIQDVEVTHGCLVIVNANHGFLYQEFMLQEKPCNTDDDAPPFSGGSSDKSTQPTEESKSTQPKEEGYADLMDFLMDGFAYQ